MIEYLVSTCVSTKARFGDLSNALRFAGTASKEDPAFTYYVSKVETSSEKLAVFHAGVRAP